MFAFGLTVASDVALSYSMDCYHDVGTQPLRAQTENLTRAIDCRNCVGGCRLCSQRPRRGGFVCPHPMDQSHGPSGAAHLHLCRLLCGAPPPCGIACLG